MKNRILDDERTLDRKAQELVLAYRLKHELGPERVILEYLNTAYFGENSYGVATAAGRIVGKQLGELTVADAALLAGLIRSPARTAKMVSLCWCCAGKTASIASPVNSSRLPPDLLMI